MSAVKVVDYSELKKNIGALLEAGEKGTIQYFCDKVKCDDDNAVAFALCLLEADGKAQLLKTRTVHEGSGYPVIMGIYGKPKE